MSNVQAGSVEKDQHGNEKKSLANTVWEQLNGNVSVKGPLASLQKPTSSLRPKPEKVSGSHNWMAALGLTPKRAASCDSSSGPVMKVQNAGDETKKLAAAALSAVKDVSTGAGGAAARGKVEISEIHKFAGEEIEVKKLVEADSREAEEKMKATVSQSSGLDAILDQIKKKPKLSVLDKTKKDWGEFKDENKGLEDELDAYKKSSNQYLDRVNFLERTDLREFEREREVRLAMQAKRRTETPGDF